MRPRTERPAPRTQRERPERAERPAPRARAERAAPAEHAERPAAPHRPTRDKRPTRAPHDEAPPLVWFSINVGRSKNADPKWLIPLLCRRGGISKNAIGKIQILARETRVEIAHDVSERFAAAVREPDAKDRNIHIEPIDDFAV
jgi:ATP-dependent RNA helicase DeaD